MTNSEGQDKTGQDRTGQDQGIDQVVTRMNGMVVLLDKTVMINTLARAKAGSRAIATDQDHQGTSLRKNSGPKTSQDIQRTNTVAE